MTEPMRRISTVGDDALLVELDDRAWPLVPTYRRLLILVEARVLPATP